MRSPDPPHFMNEPRAILSLIIGLHAAACTESTTEPLTDDDRSDTGADVAADPPDAVTIGVDSGAEPDAATHTYDDISTAPDVAVDVPSVDVPPPDPNLCDQAQPRVENPWVPASGDIIMRDTTTGSLWNARGEAFSGPCEGVVLEQLPSHNAFWFSWSISRDGHPIWNQSEPNAAGAIEPDPAGDCLVPCDEIRSGGPPPDGIPALDVDGRWGRPAPARMVGASDDDAAYLANSDMVLGVYLDGQARASPVSPPRRNRRGPSSGGPVGGPTPNTRALSVRVS